MDQTQEQAHVEQQYEYRAYESFLFTYRTKNKIGVLLGHVFQFRLCSIPARADGDFRLVDIIASTGQVFFQPQYYFDADLLMRLQDLVENIVARVQEAYRGYHECRDKYIDLPPFAQG